MESSGFNTSEIKSSKLILSGIELMGEGDVISCSLSEMIVEQGLSSFFSVFDDFQSGVHDSLPCFLK